MLKKLSQEGGLYLILIAGRDACVPVFFAWAKPAIQTPVISVPDIL
ncbi:MAG: hypothetical protein ACRD6X_18515 [Pyrinomonadaceae bacterium]